MLSIILMLSVEQVISSDEYQALYAKVRGLLLQLNYLGRLKNPEVSNYIELSGISGAVYLLCQMIEAPALTEDLARALQDNAFLSQNLHLSLLLATRK